MNVRNTESNTGSRSRDSHSLSRKSSNTLTRRSWLVAKEWSDFNITSLSGEFAQLKTIREWSGDTLTSPTRGGDHLDKGAVDVPAPPSPPDIWQRVDSCSLYNDDDTGYSEEARALIKAFLQTHGFKWYSVVLYIFSIVCYLADIVSDAYLSITYYKQSDYFWSGLTMSLMIFPALVMTGFSLAWYALDLRAKVDPPRTARAWTLRLILHALQLSPIVRQTDALLYGLRSIRPGISLTEAFRLTRFMLFEGADSCMLRLMECFMEAAPQLLLQLYIILSQPEPPKHTSQLVAQYVSCGTSWLSLAYCLTAYQSALRNSRLEKANLSRLGFAFYMLWKASVLASRLLALALLAVACSSWFVTVGSFPTVFAACLGIHWLCALIYLIYRGTTFCSTESRTFTEILFNIVLAAVFCFDIINVREGRSRGYYAFCYSVIGIENTLASLVWYLQKNIKERESSGPGAAKEISEEVGDYLLWLLPCVVLFTFTFGIAMMLAYYKFAHPLLQNQMYEIIKRGKQSNIIDEVELEKIKSTSGTEDQPISKMSKQSETIDEIECKKLKLSFGTETLPV